MSISDELPASTVPVVVSAVRWEEASNGFIPSGAVCGGVAFDDEKVYIGRTSLLENRNELTPGVVIPSQGHLIVSYGTGVRTSKKYEVLVTSDLRSVQWVPCSAGQVPTNAVIGGIDCSYLEPLYIGKTTGDLSLGRTWRGQRFPDYMQQLSLPGKVHRSHKCLYIPFNGKEYLFRDYEVLKLTTTPAALSVICKCLLRDHLLSTIKDTMAVGPELLRSNAMLVGDAGDAVETSLTQKIDALPLPPKLKEFCKQGME